MKEIIRVGNEELTITTKPLTFILHNDSIEAEGGIKYPNRMVLDSVTTVFHAERVKKLHDEFIVVWNKFFIEMGLSDGSKSDEAFKLKIGSKTVADDIRKMGRASIHLMGLIDLSLKFQDQNIPFVWVYPETFMSQVWQLKLANLAVYFMNRQAFIDKDIDTLTSQSGAEFLFDKILNPFGR